MRAIGVLTALACIAVMGSFFVSAGRVEAKTGKVKIVSVKCVKPTQGSDSDEIFFRFSSDQRFPEDSHDIKKGDTWRPNHSTGIENYSVIELYEDDTIGDDDLIGKIEIGPSASGQMTFHLSGDSSKYVVVLEVNWSGRTRSQPARNKSKVCRYYQEFQRSGAVHELPANTEQDYVGDFWHDKISSYQVSPGCRLRAFVDRDFNGPSKTFYGSKDVPPDWNGRISSVKCTC